MNLLTLTLELNDSSPFAVGALHCFALKVRTGRAWRKEQRRERFYRPEDTEGGGRSARDRHNQNRRENEVLWEEHKESVACTVLIFLQSLSVF